MKQNRVPRIEYSGKEPSKFRANHRSKDRIVDGLVFTDPRGQWAHPGQITEIPGTSSGTSITMDGVNYPVQGIDNTGYSQMMYPGMDYQFPGQYVTEYPQMQIGGLIKKGLTAAKKVVKNTYKVNPWAEKLKNPNSSYRVAGLDAYDDFKNTGILRSVTAEAPKGVSLKERAMYRPTAFPSFQKGYADLNYLPDKGGVIFKTDLPTFKRGDINPVTGFPIKGRHYAHRVIDPKTGAAINDIPASNIEVYSSEPHWLKGFMGIPKKAYGGDPSLTNIEGHYPFGGQNTKTHTHMKGGGSLNRKVTCSNCGWSWKLVDGGTDPMTCHKCGGTIKMQNGGWLDELPEAQIGRIVKAGLKGIKKLNPIRVADKVVPQVGGLLNPAVLMGVENMNAMSMSPLNWVPGYGKKLQGKGQAFRKFGNDLQHVKDEQVLSPAGGSKMRIGRDQIVNEGNWAQPNEVNDSYPGVFEATVNPQIKGTNLDYKAIHNRNGVLITDAKGQNLPEISISDPGLSFNRRLPFSNRYVPINKEKLIKKEFDLARTAPHLQSLAEKALGAAGVIAVHDYIQGDNKSDWFPQIKNQLDKSYNKVSKYVGPYLPKEEDGGWLDTMQKGGISRDNTSVKKPNILNPTELANAQPYRKLSKEEQMPMYVDSAIANRQPDELRKTKKQGFGSKAHEVFMNPFTALTNLYQHGTLPDNFSQGETNALDFAVGAINPLTYLEAAYNTGKAAFDPETYKDLGKTVGLGVNALAGDQSPDEWKQAGLNTLFKGLDASMVKGAGNMVSKNAKRIINKNINKTSKNIKKGLEEQAGKYYQNAPGKMEGIGDIKDIKRSLMREDQYLKPSEYNSKAIPFSSYKPQAGGYTDVPEFNQELNNMMTTASFGKRPLGKNVKTNPATSKNALMEALDNARYEEGITDLLPVQYMKKAKIPYNAKKAFQNIQPNKYGGLIMQKGGEPIKISDNRKIRATTGKKINPNKDLKTGWYDRDVIDSIAENAIRRNIDPYQAIAMGLIESNLGGTDYNVGHVMNFDESISPYKQMMDKIINSQATAKRLNKKNTADIIQAYNGYGKLFPNTEKDYHGHSVKAFYGVPVDERGLDLKKNPLYGKEVLDIQKNIIEKDPNIKNIITSYLYPRIPREPKYLKDWSNLLPQSIRESVKKEIDEEDISKAVRDQLKQDNLMRSNNFKKRGGQKGLKKYTSKNIQSSVNDLFMRNETLFGPAGKKRYKPGLKYKSGGGWLDNFLD